ncbi:MAG: hypothetical protein AAB573_02345, partial [Patescibacteria group bacterium]
MKKILAAFLILAILTPTFAFAAEVIDDMPISGPRGGGQGPSAGGASVSSVNGSTPYANTTSAAEEVGCDSGGSLGGSLAQMVGAAFQGIVGKGASELKKALGGGLAGKIGGILIGAGTRYFNNLIATYTNKAVDALKNAAGSAISGALTGVNITPMTPGAQAFLNSLGITDPITGIAGIGGEVPVNDKSVIKAISDLHGTVRIIDGKTTTIKEAQETLVTKECIADPLVQRIKQQLIAMITKSMLDWINNGFEGGPAFVQNLRQFLRGTTEAVLYDFVNNQLSGICSPFQNDVKTVLISQYQFQDSFQKRIQCTSEATDASSGGGGNQNDNGPNANLAEGGVGNQFNLEKFWNSTFNPQNTPQGAFREADAEQRLQERSKAAEELEKLRYGDGFRSQETCETDAGLPEGASCVNGKVVLPGALIRDQASSKVDAGFQQLLTADEISEIIDSLMAGLLDVAFQGIDGLLGLSDDGGGSGGGARRGSYLDQLVSGPSQETTDTAQDVIIGDVNGVATVEASYKSLLEIVLAALRQTRTVYVQVKQCYTTLAGTNPSYAAFATGQAQYASSTVSTIVEPLIRETEADLADSEDALSMLEDLFAQVQSATTPEAINAAS